MYVGSPKLYVDLLAIDGKFQASEAIVQSGVGRWATMMTKIDGFEVR